jgi:hypothetical protein
MRTRLVRTLLDRATKAGMLAAAGPDQPPVEMGGGVGRVGEAVEVARAFFELPAPVEN